MIYKNVPGVRIEEISLLPPSVAGVATGIPAFIGHTEKAKTLNGELLDLKAKRINSLREYVENFGMAQPEDDLEVTIIDILDTVGTKVIDRRIDAKLSATPTTGVGYRHNMYYALQLYFANGGGPCYIISVGGFDIANGMPDSAKLQLGLGVLESEDEPTIIVFPEAIYLTPNNYFTLYDLAMQQCADLKDRVVIIDVLQSKSGITNDINTVFRGENLKVDNLRFGAAYYPYLETTLDYDYTGKEDKISITHIVKNADLTDNTLTGTLAGKLNALKTTNNQVYEQIKQVLTEITLTMPPSPAMAGVYARVDSERGVWKAPANVGVSAIVGPSIKISDADQDYMNIDATTGKSVNAIRTITGRGTVVWGARTLDGNSNEWRYIPVRRFFNFVEESVKKATYRFVFEPNDANTWVKVRGMVENFLTLQWRDGALQGAKPEDAFFVRVGVPQTMTQDDVNNGRMIVEIGMAVVRPAEFIILRFSHKMPGA